MAYLFDASIDFQAHKVDNGHLHIGQLNCRVFFLTSDQHETGTWDQNFLKLQILASYNNLRIEQDSEFAKF